MREMLAGLEYIRICENTEIGLSLPTMQICAALQKTKGEESMKSFGDLWWISDEPPFIHCREDGIKGLKIMADGSVNIVDADDNADAWHTRYACTSYAEALEQFRQLVRFGKIELERFFEGISELDDDEIIRRLDAAEALAITARPRMTNADRLKKMTVDEMAHFFANAPLCDKCVDIRERGCCSGECYGAIIEWLNEEA